MKVRAQKQIITREPVDIEIEEVTLLSAKEYANNQFIISSISDDWWTRSPGFDSGYVTSVRSDERRQDYGVNWPLAVRPALRINSLRYGERFELFGFTWRVLSDGLALCEAAVGWSCFRVDKTADDANVYEKSDVKKWLDDWARKKGLISE